MKFDKVTILVKKAELTFEKKANPLLQNYDLTDAQYKILKYLCAHQTDAVRQVDLEKYYSMTHPTTIGLLDTLEKKGFVIRKPNPADARSRVISLTDKALAMQEQLSEIGDTLESQFTKALTEEERVQLVELLQKLLSSFEEIGNERKM